MKKEARKNVGSFSAKLKEKGAPFIIKGEEKQKVCKGSRACRPMGLRVGGLVGSWACGLVGGVTRGGRGEWGVVDSET